MHRFFTLAAACLISGAMAFGQSAATTPAPDTQSSAVSGAQTTAPTRNGRAATRDNQALPGNTNPANAAADNGTANGQAVAPDQNGNAAKTNPNAGNDNNGMTPDQNGNNMASGRGPQTFTSPHTGGTMQWFWIALGIIVGLFVIGLIFARSRPRAAIDRNDPAVRATQDRNDVSRNDANRRDGGIRKVS
ncbi:MAG TPA: LPXTG cell wall anchor domain-containing protein [Terriglobales bacterium]|nr:LPXTG cell wall anchor domain-containing protein [Terriglobales bacterium]